MSKSHLLRNYGAALRRSLSNVSCQDLEPSLDKMYRVSRLVSAYQSHGHLVSDIEPLGIGVRDPARAPFKLSEVKQLSLEYHGLNEKCLPEDVFVGHDIASILKLESSFLTLESLINRLHTVYCGTVSAEFVHLRDDKAAKFVQEALVTINSREKKFDESAKMNILGSLIESECFEQFCGRKFSGAKRFSIEGCESLIPGLQALFFTASALGVQAIEMGMAHRGRLNLLKNVLGVPAEAILANFNPYLPDELDEYPSNSDDVRYHLGTNRVVAMDDKFGLKDLVGFPRYPSLHISLASNPSHLEAINPVVLGKARARQFLNRGDIHLVQKTKEGKTRMTRMFSKSIGIERSTSFENTINIYGVDSPLGKAGSVDYSPGDKSKLRIAPVLIHGDASLFQGVVKESLGLSRLRDYTTGGAIHVVVNNQIGFTTTPKDSHSGTYCTDAAKTADIPVFHVNADDPEAVVLVFSKAMEYRQKFLRDCIVMLWGYRRHGHNEQDNPEITQPIMYKAVDQHPTVTDKYSNYISEATNDCDVQKTDLVKRAFDDLAESAKKSLDLGTEVYKVWNEISEEELNVAGDEPVAELDSHKTKEYLSKLGKNMFTLPDSSSFNSHSKVQKIFNDRLKMLEGKGSFDWAAAEMLSLGSLLSLGYHVRLSGQDVERGTFNQRHAVVYDQERQNLGEEIFYKPWTSLQDFKENVAKRPGVLEINNSPLSEEGVLGFELGYSLYSDKILTIWEAQYGDFANCAQTIIDTMIVSSKEKWDRSSNLVLLLPHGLEGQGPDHSSARLERFLQLGAMSVKIRSSNGKKFGDVSTKTSVPWNNIKICQPTTPAQYFHLLRMQAMERRSVPLFIFSPKSLLHHKPCRSSWDEITSHKKYQNVIMTFDGAVDEIDIADLENIRKECRKVVFCSGKLFYNLLASMRGKNTGILVIRVETLFPFPEDEISEILTNMNIDKSIEILWAQEEPLNMGAATFVEPRIRKILDSLNTTSRLEVVGRNESSAAASGSFGVHLKEQQALLARILE